MEQDLIDTTTAPIGRSRPAGYRLHLPPVDLNRIGAGLVTGAVAGVLIGGIGARLAMRVVALLGEGIPSFSVGGTLGILLMGAVLGAIGGLGFALVRWLLRLRAGDETSSLRNILAGAGYGAILSALVVLPFFLAPTGELSLASPLVGAALFGWIPLAYGLALGIATPWLERRMAVADRSVGLGWLAAFGMALMLALAGMAPLLGEFVSFPQAATELHYDHRLGLSSRPHPAPLDRAWGHSGLLRPDKPGLLARLPKQHGQTGSRDFAALRCRLLRPRAGPGRRHAGAAARGSAARAVAGRRAKPDAGSTNHLSGRTLCAALDAAHGRRLVWVVTAVVRQPIARYAAGC